MRIMELYHLAQKEQFSLWVVAPLHPQTCHSQGMWWIFVWLVMLGFVCRLYGCDCGGVVLFVVVGGLRRRTTHRIRHSEVDKTHMQLDKTLLLSNACWDSTAPLLCWRYVCLCIASWGTLQHCPKGQQAGHGHWPASWRSFVDDAVVETFVGVCFVFNQVLCVYNLHNKERLML
jgi:hypothetical protein